MLVLTRRPGEQIVIGDNIRLTVVSIGPGRVKLGIDAPPNVRIDRQEIHDKIQHERSEDVLAAVAVSAQGGETQAIPLAGSDTSVKLHNRIADVLPTPPAAETSAPADADDTVNRMARHPLPRKPR